MKYFLLTISWLCLADGLCRADELGDAVHGVLQQVSPSVVRIQTVGTGDDLDVSSQVTTGVVLSESGYVLSSAFGFGGQSAGVFVKDSQGDRVTATIVARDNVRKLVLLKCASGKFQPAKFASGLPQVGEYAIAAGRLYPTELPNVSVGIISALNRIHGLALQTDAKISPVNYGGPILNLAGEVVGILVPLSPRETGGGIEAGVEWYDSGIGFAIPASEAMDVAKRLRDGKDRMPGILGVEPSTRNPLAASFTLKTVGRNSPAEAAGLKVGDRIQSVNGIEVARFGEFESVFKSAYAGDVIAIVAERDGQEIAAEVTLVESLPPVQPGWLGLMATGNTGEKKVEVVINPGSPVAEVVQETTLWIAAINDEQTSGVSTLLKQLNRIAADDEFRLLYSLKPKGEEQTAKIKAALRPSRLPVMTAAQLSLAVVSSKRWSRDEIKDEERKKNSWYYAPDASTESVGLVLDLSSSSESAEAVLQRWKDVCESQNLILFVANNAEGTTLSREDAATIVKDVATFAKGRKLDADRITLVSRRDQADLCLAILLNPRTQEFRRAVFPESWPPTASLSASLVARKSPRVLFLAGQSAARTTLALQQAAAKNFDQTGATTSLRVMDNSEAQMIAEWLLEQKVR